MSTLKDQIIGDITGTIEKTIAKLWTQRKRITDTFNQDKNVNINIEVVYDHGSHEYGIDVNGYLLDVTYPPAELATMADKVATIYQISTQAGVTNLLETESTLYVEKQNETPDTP